jgi:hypothetical protein
MVGNRWNLKKTSYKNGYLNFMTCFKIVEKNEMGGACSTYDGREGRVRGFGGET